MSKFVLVSEISRPVNLLDERVLDCNQRYSIACLHSFRQDFASFGLKNQSLCEQILNQLP
jgi:hypothetical protein